MRAVFVKEFQELRRDRRTLGMLVVMPLLLLVIFGYAANFTVDEFKVAIVGAQTDQVETLIDDNDDLSDTLDVISAEPDATKDDAEELLVEDRADVAIVADSDAMTVLIDGSNLFAAQSALVLFTQAEQQMAQNPQAPPVEIDVLFNPDLKTSWVMIPAIIGLIVTFIGTIITSIGLVRERESGTLEQLAVMPLRSTGVILGKIMPYFLLAAFDLVLIAVLGIWLFDVPFVGNVWVFALGAAIFLFAVLGIGLLISSVSQTSGQAIQLAMMTLLPQILLSGMIFPLDAMAAGVRWIGYLLPLTYFTMISQGVMLRGAPLDSLWLPLTVLTVMAIVIFGLAVFRLHASISPAKPSRVARRHARRASKDA
ncbi:ABC transporter permease [Microbacterium sp. C7(2022)]|uniref:ABC transporter permease n=1 Tax=Microbacterium sp. C7(2022) TaxID=2992759 RepID=UPI00237A2FD2|nr:ABC transporter permease [Microbacterium sp. C7(2022)]MDE0545223.1 ABC transporter permease [Microbacterium sp. C7(2022)]